MAERLQVYKCEACGLIVEVLHEAPPGPVCCDEPMKWLEEGTVDAAREKHVPVIDRSGSQVKVRVGSVPPPMEQAHYIEWVQVLADGKA
ncbi:MAG: desulfoferrodoxin FeS4 iron-binding domain-containing protein, partial [Armatimonadota bacterium]